MQIHREGYASVLIVFVPWAISVGLVIAGPFFVLMPVISGLLFILLCFVLYFFRHPSRQIPEHSRTAIYAPADGKVVAIEETTETEYFNDRRIQISIFMSPLDVHVNRVPIDARLTYLKHHPGKYLVAWHPKSSTENERVTYVLQTSGNALLLRQIAGAVARRIVPLVTKEQQLAQGEELGFIKFGSRCDILLPVDTRIDVKIGDKVKGNLDIIGHFSS